MVKLKHGTISSDDVYGAVAGTGTLCLRTVCCVFLISAIVVLLMMMNNDSSVSNMPPFIRPPSTSVLDFDSIRGVELRTQLVSSPDKGHYHAVSSDSLLNFSFPVPHLPRPTYPSILRKDQRLEQGLSRARASIKKAAELYLRNHSSETVSGNVYRNAAAFYRSYMEMEKRFKVYVYKEGDLPMVHDGPCKSIYASEGRFIREMEHADTKFRTSDPHLAHVFFMPFSVAWMVKFLYKPNSYNVTPFQVFISDYVRVISTKYPFWNRTQGANHFMLSCHDWGPHASRGNSFLYNTSIRVLCNANSSEGFNPKKDVSLPEINLVSGHVPAKIRTLPSPNSPRPHLAFFAGGVHGPIRPILLKHWKDRDSDIQVYEYLPKGQDYYAYMLHSKFCLCPSGYEVASPRIVEAIYSECVPVIISDHYVLPFSDVLRWEDFSIQVEVSNIPYLKEILMAVPSDKYMKMKEDLRAVRKHFVFNHPAQKFDMFHMLLHSIWLRRLNLNLRIG